MNQTLSSVKISFGISLTLIALGAGCSKSSVPASTQSGGSVDTHALYASDVAGFANLDPAALSAFDNQNNHLFTKIFGGPDAASVQKYFSDRIHYAFSESDLSNATITPNSFQYYGWQTDPNQKQIPAGETGAYNMSTEIWIEAVLNNEQANLIVGDQIIPIDSTRTGIMVFGDGYVSTVTDSAGTVYTLPPAYRQAILVHEGRHSDCTDGLPEREIEIMRNATTAADFLKQIPLPHCGHTHIECPSGTYADLPACDAEKYGAYKVGAIYAEATMLSQADDVSKKIMLSAALDYESRFIDTGSQAPDELNPNMTSAGKTP